MNVQPPGDADNRKTCNMKPLIVLLVTFTASVLIFRLFSGSWNVCFSGNLAMCLMLCFTAMGHFMFTKGMAMMIPAFIPYRTGWVYATGVLEILFGIALMFAPTRYYSGWALIIFFTLILPTNIYAAIKHLNIEKGTFDGPGPQYLWFRIPMQLFLIAWILYFSINGNVYP